ncbi:hypothetical protein HYZ99_00440, partial [Candidatus Peregrinibacteria bacterium]|nr:hypothetical protein [Candidatus Peregrinibacteria bacterium]
AVPARGKKSALLELAEKNALLKARQSEAKWEADLRTTESALAELQSLLHLQTSPKRIECYDISHMGGTETVGSMVVFKDAKPARDHYRSFTLRAIKTGDIDDYRAIREVLQRRFKYLMAAREKSPLTFKKFKKKEMEAWNTEHPKKMPIAKGWKQEIISIEKPSSVAGVRIPRRARRDNRIPPAENVDSVLGIDMRYKKGEMRIGAMELTTKDREQLHQALDLVEKKLGKDELYVFCNDPNARDLLALHGFFLASDGFEKLPSSFAQLRRASVAARPRRDGSEDKKTLRDQSDFARLRRTTPDKSIEGDLYHRQKSAQKADPSFKSTPDLIVIDGGKGQLSSAIGILNSLSVQIPVIGLAKREEEIFVPGTSDPVTFPNDAPGKFLLMRLRDEAHRFANEHRESRGKKRAMGSALDAVPGIGPKTKKLLLRKFGSVVGIREADDSALRDVVNEDQLAALRQHL